MSIENIFNDERSGKIAVVAHCVLNQNARVPGLAEKPSTITEITEFLNRNKIGIIQMPCPELIYAGVSRQPQTKEQYANKIYRKLCGKIADEIAHQIQEYKRCKIETLFVIGVDGSPSCSVKATKCNTNRQKVRDYGILIEELQFALKKRQIEIPFYGVHYNSLKDDLAKLNRQIELKMQKSANEDILAREK